METAYLAGGCFWCVEAIFQRVKGVKKLESGYCNGSNQNPSYESVCSGQTGHAEVVKIDFDESEVSFHNLLAVFAAMMLEMRLIFVSSQLTKLSACVHAAAALLLPFSWQHIFVPVLPRIWVRHSLLESPFRRFQPNTG